MKSVVQRVQRAEVRVVERRAEAADPDDAGSDDAGSDDAGSDDAGSQDGGTDDAGSQDGGTDDAGSDEAGSDGAGSDDSGAQVVGRVGRGVMVLVGVERGDTEADADATAAKIANLRIFPGRTPMDRTLAEIEGGALVVSQFTLAGTVRKGRRPGFDRAEAPARAKALYERVAQRLRETGLPVQTGRFGASMEVELVNDGPVTLLVFSQGGTVQ